MILVSPYSRNKNLFDAYTYPETLIRSCPWQEKQMTDLIINKILPYLDIRLQNSCNALMQVLQLFAETKHQKIYSIRFCEKIHL